MKSQHIYVKLVIINGNKPQRHSSAEVIKRNKGEYMGYRELIKKVQQFSGFSDAESQEALNRTVESLASQLTEEERQDFASQLPPELQDKALAADTDDISMKKDMLNSFTAKYSVEEDRAKRQLVAAWGALKEAITSGEINDIRSQLPKTTVALLQ